jgi:hypothetical protein
MATTMLPPVGDAPGIIDLPILDSGFDLDDKVFALRQLGKWACMFSKNHSRHGLAVFSGEGSAIRFTEWLNGGGWKPEEMTLAEAMQIAKGRHGAITCVFIADDFDNPKMVPLD